MITLLSSSRLRGHPFKVVYVILHVEARHENLRFSADASLSLGNGARRETLI